MTGRQVMKRAVARSRSATLSAFAIGLPALVVGAKLAEARHHLIGGGLAIAGIAYFVAARTWAPSLIRCPWCRADCGDVADRGDPGGLDRILCCPYCATMLDDPAPGPAKPKAAGGVRDDEFF